MAPTRIGLNFSEMGNITDLNITFPTTPKGFLEELPRNANILTNNNTGFGMMFAIFGMLYATLSDKTPLTNFGYSDIKALTISFGKACTIGLILMSVNIINNYIHIVIFGLLFVVFYIIDLIYENKE